MAGRKGAGLTEFDREILRRWAQGNMRVSPVARTLHMHPNTVRYHLDKIRRETGRYMDSFRSVISRFRNASNLRYMTVSSSDFS